MIKVSGLSKSFSKIKALHDIALEVKNLETVVILGPSGSGKTTLLECISGLIQIDRGSIHIDGLELKDQNMKDIKKKIGMVFQQFHLFNNMTILQNLKYPLSFNKSNLNPSALAIELLKRFGLEKKQDDFPHNLSNGQKQRVAIARALMITPQIMFFDEPTSALDPEKIKDLVEIIRDLKHKMTLLVVTHSIDFARAIADRIIFIDQGYILADQTNSDFFTKPRSQRAKIFLSNMDLTSYYNKLENL